MFRPLKLGRGFLYTIHLRRGALALGFVRLMVYSCRVGRKPQEARCRRGRHPPRRSIRWGNLRTAARDPRADVVKMGNHPHARNWGIDNIRVGALKCDDMLLSVSTQQQFPRKKGDQSSIRRTRDSSAGQKNKLARRNRYGQSTETVAAKRVRSGGGGWVGGPGVFCEEQIADRRWRRRCVRVRIPARALGARIRKHGVKSAITSARRSASVRPTRKIWEL